MKKVAVLTLLVASVFAGAVPVLAEVAGDRTALDAYHSAKALIAEQEYSSAISKLEQAVRLDPRKKYLRLLEEAKKAGAHHQLTLARATPTEDLSARRHLVELAVQWRPNDPQVREAAASISQELDELQEVIAQSLGSAEKDPVGALETLGTIPYKSHPFELEKAHAESEANYWLCLQRFWYFVESTQFEDALVEIEQALKHRPGDSEATRLSSELRDRVTQILLAKADVYSDDGPEQGLKEASKILDRASRICSDCNGVHQARQDLSTMLVEAVQQTLESFEALPSDLRAWTTCSIVKEKSKGFGQDLGRALLEQCGSEWPGFRVGIAWIPVDGDCPAPPSLHSKVRSSLPLIRDLVSVGELTKTQLAERFDFVVYLQAATCSEATVPVRRVEEVSSMYKAGEDHLVNPRYAEVQAELNRAVSKCDATTSVGARISCTVLVHQKREDLSKTPAYLTKVRELPYRFERFESSIVAKRSATLFVWDPSTHVSLLSKPIEVQSEDSGWGKRGVFETDRRGNRNSNPRIKSPVAVASEAERAFVEILGTSLHDTAPSWFAYRASVALQKGERAEALAYLHVMAAARDLDLSNDLTRLGERVRRDPLASGLDLSQKLPDLPSSSSSKGPYLPVFGPSSVADVLEEVLKAVVSVRCGSNSGTGFFVNDTGLLLTNYHVIDDSGLVEVRTEGEEVFLGEVLMREATRDLALIQIPASSTPYLTVVSTEGLRVGQEVYAIGNPFGLDRTVTKGIVGAIRKADEVRVLQVDAAINQGNSGGPLVLPTGEVVGINTATIRKDLADGLGFAVAIDEAEVAFGEQIQPID